ncbi:MAG: malonate decarboxylase holo-[acyl-carrier-protein] synthase [Pseudomonadota bacterium]
MPSHPYRRHDLLRIEPKAWRGMLAATHGLDPLAGEARQLVEGWAGRGWPVIVRRCGANDRDDIAVGLPLPPALGKLRLGFFIPADSGINAIAAVSPAEAARSVPTILRPQLEAITALAVRLGVRPAVFGALLWQHLTELAYLRPGSDIDLLWPAPRPDRLDELLEDLAALDAAGPARLDGEIVLPAGEAVNWRELHGALVRAGGTVLVKSMHGAELRCARRLFA